MATTKSQIVIRNVTLTFIGFALLTAGTIQPSEATCPCNKRMEAKLKSDYTYYADNYSVLEFKFKVKKQNRHVDVTLVGQNFGAWDTEWTGKDKKAFLVYLGAIGVNVSKQLERPFVKFRVIDLENHELGRFQYGK